MMILNSVRKKGQIRNCLLIVFFIFTVWVFSYSTTAAAASKTLSINWSHITSVGNQAKGSDSCFCFALAYCRTILDGRVHSWAEYDANGGTSQYNASGWYGHANYEQYKLSATSANKKAIYKAVYNSINAGKPAIVKVRGSRAPWHWIALVGYVNVSSVDSLSANNFLMIDSVIGTTKSKTENMGACGYDLNGDNGYYYYCTTNSGSVGSADNPPSGSFDGISGGNGTVHVSGWAFDTDSKTSAIDVHVYIGGAAGTGAPGYVIKANTYRDDVGRAYPGVGNYHGFDSTISTNKTGTQKVYVYAINYGGGDNNTFLGSKTVTISKYVDKTKPVISNAKVTNVTKNGYTVTCTVSDNVGVTKVSMPTWTINNGQDDLIWHVATLKGNTASYTVKRTDHKNEGGTYITDIYADDAAGNSSTVRVSATLSNQLPTGQITFAGSTDFYLNARFYDVEGTAVDADDESKQVKIELYKVDPNGTEEFLKATETRTSSHFFDFLQIDAEPQGNQTIRVYALDTQTKEKVLLGTKSFYVKKAIKAISLPPDTVNIECGKSVTLPINFSPIDAEESINIIYNKVDKIIAPEVKNNKLTIKGLKKGTTTLAVCGAWQAERSNDIRVNVIDSVCSHRYVTVVEKEATCNTTGFSYEMCSICGEKKAGSEKTIPSTGHRYVTVVESEATCNTSGFSYEKCSICGEKKAGSEKTIPSTGHRYVTVVESEATCNTSGFSYEKCSICGEKKTGSEKIIPATGKHVYVTVVEKQATCGLTGVSYVKCNVCGEKKAGSENAIPATGKHTYGNWVVIKQATTTSEGSKQRKCSVCGKIDTVLIAKLPAANDKTIGLKINVGNKITLKEGQTLKIDVTVDPVTSVEKVSFTTSNNEVVTVDSNGIVKALKAGNATIAVVSGKVKANVEVTVKQKSNANLKKKALKAYQKMLSSKASLKKKLGNSLQGIALNKVSFALAYIDDDNVPELIVNADDQYLFTYRNEKVKLVYAFEQGGDHRPFGYYKKKNVFRGYQGYYYVSLIYFSMNNGKSDMLLELDTETGYVYDYMGNLMSRSRLNSFLKSKCGNTKLSVLIGSDFKKNTSSNRKRFLK